MRLKALLALTAIAASLSACATVDRLDAGGDVHDLLSPSATTTARLLTPMSTAARSRVRSRPD